MTWVAVGGTAVSVIGGAIGGSKAKKSAAAAADKQIKEQKKAEQRAWQRSLEGNEIQKGNELWAQGINRAENEAALGRNRIDQSSDFGATNWNQDPTTGEWTQTSSIAPDLQAQLPGLRDKVGEGIGNLDMGDYGVNSAVLGALRAQSAPAMEQQRNRENARLAAMGLGTGSGSAWGQSQDALNRSENDMEQKNILGGFNAWQQGQQNIRSNLGAATGLETAWKANSAQTPFQPGQVSTPTGVDTPRFGGTGQNAFTSGMAQADTGYNRDITGANINAIGQENMWGSLAGLAANKDIQNGVSGWFGNNQPTGGVIQGGVSSGGAGNGTFQPSNKMAGFYTDPWSGK